MRRSVTTTATSLFSRKAIASLAFSAPAILNVIDDSASTVSISSRMLRSSSVMRMVGRVSACPAEAASADFAVSCELPFIDSRA